PEGATSGWFCPRDNEELNRNRPLDDVLPLPSDTIRPKPPHLSALRRRFDTRHPCNIEPPSTRAQQLAHAKTDTHRYSSASLPSPGNKNSPTACKPSRPPVLHFA